MSRWGTDDIPDQAGRTALVTGANSGLGLRAAEALAARGAAVLLGCRDRERAEVARRAVAAVATGPPPTVVALDLADLASVREAAAVVAGTVDRLDLLLDNAGVMAVPLARTADGFEMQFGTNHLGHFALTGLVLPSLLAAPAPRVVVTSSNAHRIGRVREDDPHYEAGGYRKWAAYGQSKLANLLFVLELGRQAAEHGTPVVAAAAHPGYAATHLMAASASQSSTAVARRAVGAAMAVGNRLLAQSDRAGALPLLYAATADGVSSGDYYGPRLADMWGAPAPAGRSPAAADAGAARRLWALSEELTGVAYPWP
jgi:NAD(P)-dependent dehydrogenase (short-subunit alcohol dehydrogenase family)